MLVPSGKRANLKFQFGNHQFHPLALSQQSLGFMGELLEFSLRGLSPLPSCFYAASQKTFFGHIFSRGQSRLTDKCKIWIAFATTAFDFEKSWDNSFDGGASRERIDNNNSLFFRGNHSFEERWQFCKGGHVCRQLHCLSLAMLFIQRMVVS